MKRLLFIFLILSGSLSAAVRDFYAPLTEEEKGHIRYVINTLAEKSAISLMFYKKTLEQRGNRVGNVHPLKFMGFIYADPQLRRNVKRIGGLPWRSFTQNTAESFRKAVGRDNMKDEYLDDFAREVGVDKSVFIGSVHSGNWVEFMNIVRKNL